MDNRVYLAARYGRRLEMVERACELKAAGYVSSATWLDGTHETLDESPGWGGRAAEFAKVDLEDIERSDWLVMFADDPGMVSRGGRHVELGYALALRRHGGRPSVVIIGEPECVFHWADEVMRFPTWRAFLGALVESRQAASW